MKIDVELRTGLVLRLRGGDLKVGMDAVVVLWVRETMVE